MQRMAAHHSRWRTADVVYGVSLALSFALNYFWPLSFGVPSGSLLPHLIGAPLLFGGSLIIIFSKKELLRFGQPSEPRKPTTRIVTEGLYKYSRNPMYTGLTLCFAGLGIAIDKPWLLILLVPTVIIVQQLLIRPEERYLEEKFGAEFMQYKKNVRRWM
jgi:protein-S-isoprenylcysteine O-methyltransferase Ste14